MLTALPRQRAISGTYVLGADAKIANFRNPNRIEFELHCSAQNEKLIHSEVSLGTSLRKRVRVEGGDVCSPSPSPDEFDRGVGTAHQIVTTTPPLATRRLASTDAGCNRPPR